MSRRIRAYLPGTLGASRALGQRRLRQTGSIFGCLRNAVVWMDGRAFRNGVDVTVTESGRMRSDRPNVSNKPRAA